jgi:two-component sensor histidine kinase
MKVPRWLEGWTSGLGFRLAFSLSMALLPVGILALVESSSSFRHSRELERLAIYGTAEQILDRSSRRLIEAAGSTRLIGSILVEPSLDTGACATRLDFIVGSDPRIRSAGLVPGGGQRICETPGFDALRFINGEAITDPRQQGSAVLVASGRGPSGEAERQIAFIEAVRGDGHTIGWAVTVWPEAYFGAARAAGQPNSVILDSHGLAFAATDANMLPQDFPDGVLTGGRRQIFAGTDQDGNSTVYAAIPISGTGLTALAAVPGGDAGFFDNRAYLWTLMLPVIMWGVSLCVAFWSTNRLATGPILQLEKMTNAMSRGVRDLSSMRLHAAPAELQTLSDRFVEMAEKVSIYERDLEETLAEKTFLLREVHHRVRNNLQLLVSMLNMQERNTQSKETRAALEQFRRRVFGLATAHEKLFGAEDLVENTTDGLVEEAVRGALSVAGQGTHEPRFNIAKVSVPIDSTVAFALFISEATANAISQGLLRGERPKIHVVLEETGKSTARLILENRYSSEKDATGDEGSDSVERKLGERLMQALSRQLEGRCVITSIENCYRAELSFRTKNRQLEELPQPRRARL